MSPEEQIRATVPATYEELANEYVRVRKLLHRFRVENSKLQRKQKVQQSLNDNNGDGTTVLLEQQKEIDTYSLMYEELVKLVKGKLYELGNYHKTNDLRSLVVHLIQTYENNK
jgi:hypothetical protein